LVTAGSPELPGERIVGKIGCNYFNEASTAVNNYLLYRSLALKCTGAWRVIQPSAKSFQGCSSSRERRAKFPDHYLLFLLMSSKIVEGFLDSRLRGTERSFCRIFETKVRDQSFLFINIMSDCSNKTP